MREAFRLKYGVLKQVCLRKMTAVCEINLAGGAGSTTTTQGLWDQWIKGGAVSIVRFIRMQSQLSRERDKLLLAKDIPPTYIVPSPLLLLPPRESFSSRCIVKYNLSRPSDCLACERKRLSYVKHDRKWTWTASTRKSMPVLSGQRTRVPPPAKPGRSPRRKRACFTASRLEFGDLFS